MARVRRHVQRASLRLPTTRHDHSAFLRVDARALVEPLALLGVLVAALATAVEAVAEAERRPIVA